MLDLTFPLRSDGKQQIEFEARGPLHTGRIKSSEKWIYHFVIEGTFFFYLDGRLSLQVGFISSELGKNNKTQKIEHYNTGFISL